MAGGARTLIIGPNWVGDMVMAEPVVAALRQREPTVAVDMLAPAHVLEVAARMPGIGDCIALPFSPHQPHLAERRALGRELRGRYARAIVLPNSFLSALVPWLAEIPERQGYIGEARYGLINRPVQEVRAGSRRFTARSYLHVAGLSRDEPPRLRTDPVAQRALLSEHGLQPQRYAVLFPGSEGGSAKRWPAAHFGTLAQVLATEGLTVVLVGGPRDQETTAAIVRFAPGSLDLGGQTSLGAAIDLIGMARFAIGNDTGLMHIAAATGVPVLGLYGPTPPDETPPLSADGMTLSLGLACAPCRQRDCPLGHQRCLADLMPERVLDAVRPWRSGMGGAN